MLWFIIFCSIGFFIAFLVGCYDEGLAGGIFAGAFGAGIAALFALLANGIAQEPVGQKIVQKERVELVNLSDTTSVQGRYFLGTGSTSTGPAAYYYTYTNGYYLPHLLSGGFRIFEDSDTPYLVHSRKETKDEWLSVFDEGRDVWDFHVPQGTVKKDFTIDARS